MTEYSQFYQGRNSSTPESIQIDINSINSDFSLQKSNSIVSNPEPKSKSTILYIMIIASFILAPVSVVEDVWLTQTIDRDEWGDTVFTQEVHVGLRQVMYETCVDGTDCEYSDQENFGDLYDMCIDAFEDDDGEYYDEEIDEYCGPWSDLYNAGTTTTILMTITTILLFAAFVLQGRPDSKRKSYLISISAGILIVLSLFIWDLMLPDAADNLDWGRGPWFALLAAGLSIAAGFIGYKQSKESENQFEYTS